VANGDERALADCLVSAVDAGPMTVPDDVVRALRARHDPAHHAALLSTILHEAADAGWRRGS
jgi:hypothetical protein